MAGQIRHWFLFFSFFCLFQGSINSLSSQTSLRKVKRVSRQDSKLLSPRKTPEKELMLSTKANNGAVNGDNKGHLVGLEKSEIGGVKWNVGISFLKLLWIFCFGELIYRILFLKKFPSCFSSLQVYMMFLKHMSYPASFGIMFFYFCFNGVSVGTNIWLGQWADDANDTFRRNSTEWRDYRLGVYGGLGGIQGTNLNHSFFNRLEK